MDHLAKLGDAPLTDAAALDAACGVGVVVSESALSAAVATAIDGARARLLTDRYRFPVASLLRDVVAVEPWADVGAAKSALEVAVATLLGPKTEADTAPAPKKKAVAAPKPDAAAAAVAAAAASGPPPPPTDPYAFFSSPSSNNAVHTAVPMSDGTVLRIANSRAQLDVHLAETGGGVVTRFPPEPNGYLHLGHAKACYIDFGLAKARGGKCYLRFDDTNPTAEKTEFIDHIQDIVTWLGWTPAAVTYSSDYFPRLHALAVDLIKAGHAYVCHQTPAEIKAAREARAPSPWRDRPVAESLALFSSMTRGMVDEGAATLRLRMDPGNANYNMFDLVAYRVKFAPHPHAGPRWCVYPSYDFTHCVVDAFENVTHSLCTLEFEPRRASYYWLLHVASLYKPVVWEYSRLSVTHNVLSKRKLAALVATGTVRGWDDPRLLTLAGLRRRGVPPAAINSFCADVGITRANDGEVSGVLLDAHTRTAIDNESPRALAVLAPLKVTLTNVGETETIACAGRVWPNRPDDASTYPLALTRTLRIDASDFRTEDVKGYFGLAPGKSAMLRYAGIATVTGFEADPAGTPTHVTATFAPLEPGAKPPKGVLSWVGEPAPGVPPRRFEARLYGPLFKSQSPGGLGDDWMNDVDPASETVITGALGGPPIAAGRPGDRFQLERLGFFIVDADVGADGEPVLIRTCTLRETVATKGVRKV